MIKNLNLKWAFTGGDWTFNLNLACHSGFQRRQESQMAADGNKRNSYGHWLANARWRLVCNVRDGAAVSFRVAGTYSRSQRYMWEGEFRSEMG